MAEPEWITLPEVNVGDPRRRRRRPRPVAAPVVEGIDEPAVEVAPELAGLDDAADRLRARLGVAPRVAGIDEDEPTDDIGTGLSALRTERGPMAVSRAQNIDLPGDEDSPESLEAIQGAIGQERMGMPIPPRTQLRQPQVAPPPASRLGVMQPAWPMPAAMVAGLDDEPDLSQLPDGDEDADDLGRPDPRTPLSSRDDFYANKRADKPMERPARPIPGVQQSQDADFHDQRQAHRMNVAQGALGIAGGLATLIAGSQGRQAQGPIDVRSATGVDRPRWSDAPNQRIAERTQQRQLEEQQALEAEDRAFRRQNEDRRAQLDERRIGQAEAATAEHARRTSAEFDVDSQDANGLRDVYDATINSLPEEAQRALAGWVDFDATNLNARSMAAVLEQLNEAVDTARTTNPRLFRQGQRAGGRRRSGGRLGGTGGGGRGVNYGYGVQSREGGAPMTPEQEQAAVGQPTPQAPRPASGGAPRARPATPQGAPAPAAPGAVDLRVRPPTDDEIEANRDLAYQEYLIQGAARRMGVDVNTPRGRAAAASAVDRGLGEGAEDQLVMQGAGSREQTPEQRAQTVAYVRDYGPVHQRERQLQRLGQELTRLSSQPNGRDVIRAALHSNNGITAAFTNTSPEVTRTRAMIMRYLNSYMHEMGGANVTENELMRYAASFGAGSWVADPDEFIGALARARQEEHERLDEGGVAYPEGQRAYLESLGGGQ